jgi:hypothetical protein
MPNNFKIIVFLGQSILINKNLKWDNKLLKLTLQLDVVQILDMVMVIYKYPMDNLLNTIMFNRWYVDNIK